jgi:hypothetical protein
VVAVSLGSYNIVWIIAIGLSIVAALANFPIKEKELIRTPQGSAAAMS